MLVFFVTAALSLLCFCLVYLFHCSARLLSLKLIPKQCADAIFNILFQCSYAFVPAAVSVFTIAKLLGKLQPYVNVSPASEVSTCGYFLVVRFSLTILMIPPDSLRTIQFSHS